MCVYIFFPFLLDMYDFVWGEAFLHKVEQFPHRLILLSTAGIRSMFNAFFLVKRISFHFFGVFFLRYQYFVELKVFGLSIKTLLYFAHRLFSTQEKFAHRSKNPGCATDSICFRC